MLLGGAVASTVPFFRLRMCCPFFPCSRLYSACGSWVILLFFFVSLILLHSLVVAATVNSISPSLFHFNFFDFFSHMQNVHLGFCFIVVSDTKLRKINDVKSYSTLERAKCELHRCRRRLLVFYILQFGCCARFSTKSNNPKVHA